jgi:hypothetical protein
MLMDQYKISVLRNPGYFMMFWFWLGMSIAVARSLRAHGGLPERREPASLGARA